MREFRAAVEARDHDAMTALLAEDVVFRSPVAHTPYEGRAITSAILGAVMRVFEDFTYQREISSADGREHVLVFTAVVSGKEVTGIDLLTLGDDGTIEDFTVMVRPLSAANAVAAAMKEQYPRIVEEASRA